MADVDTIWTDWGGDIALAGADLAGLDPLRSEIVRSLFTDRLAAADDVLPDGSSDRRGWWGDSFAGAPGDRFGSRLWLLGREKQLASVLPRAKEYAEESLAWLVEDGVAAAVSVEAEVVRDGVLGLAVQVTQPRGRDVQKYQFVWEAL